MSDINGPTSLIPRPAPSWTVVQSLPDALALADVMARSGLFPDTSSAAQAVVKMLAGAEMGFGAIASMKGINIIDGVPSMGAHLMACKIKGSGKYDYRLHRCDREACDIEFFERRGAKMESVGRVSLTLKEAEASGWTVNKEGKTKRNWATGPDDMLFARVISKGYRRFAPDLTGGVPTYTPDEIVEVTDYTVNQAPVAAPPTQLEHRPAEPRIYATDEQIDRLQGLLDQLGTDQATLARYLRYFKVNTCSELTPQQADEFENRLQGLISQLQPTAQ